MKPGEDKCPYGHIFGEDWDDYADCDDCEIFKACKKKHEE